MKDSHLVVRGKRDYVLGADILEQALQQMYGHAQTTQLDFTVKQRCITEGCRCVPKSQTTLAEQMQALALLRDVDHDMVILPCGERVTQHMPCNEATMAEHFVYTQEDGKALVHVAAFPSGEHSLRVCVAAFKYLLNTCVVDTPRKYLFARLQLDFTPLSVFSIRYERLFAHRFHEGRILLEGKVCGAIYFTEGGA